MARTLDSWPTVASPFCVVSFVVVFCLAGRRSHLRSGFHRCAGCSFGFLAWLLCDGVLRSDSVAAHWQIADMESTRGQMCLGVHRMTMTNRSSHGQPTCPCLLAAPLPCEACVHCSQDTGVFVMLHKVMVLMMVLPLTVFRLKHQFLTTTHDFYKLIKTKGTKAL